MLAVWVLSYIVAQNIPVLLPCRLVYTATVQRVQQAHRSPIVLYFRRNLTAVALVR